MLQNESRRFQWNDWTELLITPASTDQLEKRRTETIRDLEPGTKYEATVQSRNRYGLSDVSQSFFFTTSVKNGNEFKIIVKTFEQYNSYFCHFFQISK